MCCYWTKQQKMVKRGSSTKSITLTGSKYLKAMLKRLIIRFLAHNELLVLAHACHCRHGESHVAFFLSLPLLFVCFRLKRRNLKMTIAFWNVILMRNEMVIKSKFFYITHNAPLKGILPSSRTLSSRRYFSLSCQCSIGFLYLNCIFSS